MRDMTVCGCAKIDTRAHNGDWWNDVRVVVEEAWACMLTLYNTDEETERMRVNVCMNVKKGSKRFVF